LFTQEPPLPAAFGSASSVVDKVARKKAQDQFVEYLKAEKRSQPLLAARFIGRQIGVETTKLAEKVQNAASGGKKQKEEENRNDFTDAMGGDFLLAEHMEKLRFLAMGPNEGGLPLLSGVLEKTLPGLEQFVTRERYSMLLGKMAYNAVGVGHRDDKVCSFAVRLQIPVAHRCSRCQNSPNLQHALKTLKKLVRLLAPNIKLVLPSTRCRPMQITLVLPPQH